MPNPMTSSSSARVCCVPLHQSSPCRHQPPASSPLYNYTRPSRSLLTRFSLSNSSREARMPVNPPRRIRTPRMARRPLRLGTPPTSLLSSRPRLPPPPSTIFAINPYHPTAPAMVTTELQINHQLRPSKATAPIDSAQWVVPRVQTAAVPMPDYPPPL